MGFVSQIVWHVHLHREQLRYISPHINRSKPDGVDSPTFSPQPRGPKADFMVIHLLHVGIGTQFVALNLSHAPFGFDRIVRDQGIQFNCDHLVVRRPDDIQTGGGLDDDRGIGMDSQCEVIEGKQVSCGSQINQALE